ncbi:hypothetical protein ACQKLX_18635 [Bosea sp. NPDC003192]|uniref:hypothetical protein n=1 Tax=Bosea sp. NPDC003192 TaxID=3390551 RepID=UPI003D0564D7
MGSLKGAASISAVILALIASAVWDFAFKPIILVVYEAIVSLGTLGISSLRDGIYEEIGFQRTQSIGIYLLLLFTGLFMSLSSAPVFAYFGLNRRVKPDRVPSRKSLVWRNSFMYFSIFFSSLIFMLTFRAIYVSQTTDMLRNYQVIIAPYISLEERLNLASRAARISSKDDFMSIIVTINDVMRKHNIKMREIIII